MPSILWTHQHLQQHTGHWPLIHEVGPRRIWRKAKVRRRTRPVEMTLDRDSPHPVYLQIQEQLRFLIESNQLAPDSKLPSAQQLADNLNINRNTVLSAYAELARAG